MLENATVTMTYKELKELLNKLDENKEIVERYKREKDIEEWEKDPYKKSLDEICSLAEKASECSKASDKQHFIHRIMLEYCRVFDIPENEIMENIHKGTEPNK